MHTATFTDCGRHEITEKNLLENNKKAIPADGFLLFSTGKYLSDLLLGGQ